MCSDCGFIVIVEFILERQLKTLKKYSDPTYFSMSFAVFGSH